MAESSSNGSVDTGSFRSLYYSHTPTHLYWIAPHNNMRNILLCDGHVKCYGLNQDKALHCFYKPQPFKDN